MISILSEADVGVLSDAVCDVLAKQGFLCDNRTVLQAYEAAGAEVDYGAQVAAYFGLPYAFAWFFADGAAGAQAMKVYQSSYKPSERHPEPNSALCVFALCADTEEEATYHFQPRARFRLARGRAPSPHPLLPRPTPR